MLFQPHEIMTLHLDALHTHVCMNVPLYIEHFPCSLISSSPEEMLNLTQPPEPRFTSICAEANSNGVCVLLILYWSLSSVIVYVFLSVTLCISHGIETFYRNSLWDGDSHNSGVPQTQEASDCNIPWCGDGPWVWGLSVFNCLLRVVYVCLGCFLWFFSVCLSRACGGFSFLVWYYLWN